jgi:dienelactone hydrolase
MVDLAGRTAVIVDDGIATGATAAAACAVARAHGAERVILAAPVASVQAVAHLSSEADEVVVVGAPSDMGAIGAFYADFSPTSDSEVRRILQGHAQRALGSDGRGDSIQPSSEVSITLPGVTLPGLLTLSPGASSVVIFAHGSGSSRNSPRNRNVAAELNRAGHGTLLFDLLTEEESGDRHNVFDIPLLGERLKAATSWLNQTGPGDLEVGYFGASTGAAAALVAAADMGDGIGAVVSRGGRPDLARTRLPSVTAPTLLIVGGRDTEVLALNRDAASRLTCSHQLEVVTGATHLFEEPGALKEVAHLAVAWFDRHLG